MIENQFTKLFQSLAPEIRQVLSEVIDLEQEHISFERPRIKEPLDDIILSAAKALFHNSQSDDQGTQ